jgi:catechol 2,3-dioxygenase-like lactoylglutathione lyase family enzyme
VTGARLAAIVVGGPSAPWESLGFAVDRSGRVPFANGAIEFDHGATAGMVGLVIDGVDDMAGDLEGVPLLTGIAVAPIEHPNGAFELDHVVVVTDSLERTSGTVTDVLGLECRRIREAGSVRQAFHRFGDQGGTRGCILEVVESRRVERTGLFGLVVNVADLDALAVRYEGGAIGPSRDAVQPGRRIATVRADAGLGVAVALMTPT